MSLHKERTCNFKRLLARQLKALMVEISTQANDANVGLCFNMDKFENINELVVSNWTQTLSCYPKQSPLYQAGIIFIIHYNNYKARNLSC